MALIFGIQFFHIRVIRTGIEQMSKFVASCEDLDFFLPARARRVNWNNAI
jgi:hypothetical protein